MNWKDFIFPTAVLKKANTSTDSSTTVLKSAELIEHFG
jgi:hypothetical protein